MDYIIVPIIWIVLIVLLIAFIASNIVIVPQAKAYVIERLGTYRDTWSTGLHFKVPLFERIARKVTLKEQVVDFPPQPVITKDRVLPDYRPEAVCIRYRKPDGGNRKSDCNHTAKHHR